MKQFELTINDHGKTLHFCLEAESFYEAKEKGQYIAQNIFHAKWRFLPSMKMEEVHYEQK